MRLFNGQIHFLSIKPIKFAAKTISLTYKDAFVKNLQPQKNNPLHGKTLEAILTELVKYYGWEQLGHKIKINCFVNDPSVKSSLKFLRKTPWARTKVEELYVELFHSGKP